MIWYAQYNTNWTNPDPTLGSDPSVTSIWNSQADGLGTWGMPTTGDTANLNGKNVEWSYSADGGTFMSGTSVALITGSGTFTTTTNQVLINQPLTVDASVTTFSGGASGIMVQTTLTINCPTAGTGNWSVNSSGSTLIATAGFTPPCTVDTSTLAIFSGGSGSAPTSIAAGGIVVIKGSDIWGGTVANAGVLILDGSPSGLGATGNPAIKVPTISNVLTGASDYGIVGSAAAFTPTYVSPATTNVKSGVAYGPSSSLIGSYAASGSSGVSRSRVQRGQ